MGQEIGRGGFGTVFQALNTNTGDFVAVKRVALHDIDNDSLASIKVDCCCYCCVSSLVSTFVIFQLMHLCNCFLHADGD
jgi:serine/threonine protein kinase